MRIRKREKDELLSSKQKGTITENRAAELITIGSRGSLTCYIPTSDDEGIDLIVNPKSEFKPLFIQIKSRSKLRKNQFIQNVAAKTFKTDKCFYLLFLYFSLVLVEVEKVWLIPSKTFEKLAYKKKEGKTHKSFYRFSANPYSSRNKWAKYLIDKGELGNGIERIIAKIYDASGIVARSRQRRVNSRS